MCYVIRTVNLFNLCRLNSNSHQNQQPLNPKRRKKVKNLLVNHNNNKIKNKKTNKKLMVFKRSNFFIRLNCT